MNWTVEFPNDEAFVVVATTGDFDLKDHARMIEDIVTQDFWRPGLDVLFDHRNLRFSRASLEFMQQASANHEANDERIGDGKAAILMKSLADFGRGRQFEMIAADKISAKLKVFMCRIEAEKWLLE